MQSFDLAKQILEELQNLNKELNDYVVSRKIVAGKRARAKTLEVTKMFKLFRAASINDSKSGSKALKEDA